jgi:hypothetical protein
MLSQPQATQATDQAPATASQVIGSIDSTPFPVTLVAAPSQIYRLA